jgi:glycosyltransferase involved in cell wall biosynthesis
MRFNGVYVLWEDPLVLSCFGEHDRARFLRLKVEATVLCFFSWLQTWRSTPRLVRDYVVGRARRKSLHFMTNSPDEERVLRSCGLPTALVNHNAYIDERVFVPTGAAKEYDAVYTAQMQPFKRLHLATQVPSLFVVTYGDKSTSGGEYDLPGFVPELAHAEYNRRWLGFDEINDVYNRSRVGLALSAVEGAMLAAVEYMLAGLPLVSTPCRGGRELFFDDRFVAIVQPTARHVAEGVCELIRRQVDPGVVRNITLERLRVHRYAMCAYVQQVIRDRGGAAPDVERLYETLFDGESGITKCFVHSRDFGARGWL